LINPNEIRTAFLKGDYSYIYSLFDYEVTIET